MAYIPFNPNPFEKATGDCTVRAISMMTNQDWDDTYWGLAIMGFVLKDMPSNNEVWGAYLRKNGYVRDVIPNTCPDCYSVKDFCEDNPDGRFLLATGSHVIAVEDGDYYDAWNSGNEVPIYYWYKENE